MKVLIVDKLDVSCVKRLRDAGCDVVLEPDTTAATMQSAIENHSPNILVVRGTTVSAEAIACGSQLSLIVRAGAGYDSIDVAQASRRGIYVANCPGKNSVAVAELAWGLILACDRRIPDQVADLRNRVWDKKRYAKASGLKGRTLGIVGLGQIGQEIARRGQAFGMEVIAWSRSLSESKATEFGVGYCSNLESLAQQSDVVSVSVAANPETEKLIDRAFIANMKDDAYFINTSRGSTVDQDALAEAISKRGIRAGLDVFANEPGSGEKEFTDSIVDLPGVFGTHHVGASTDQAQAAVADEAVRVILEFVNTGQVANCVNLASQTTANWILVVRHLNLPGVLAHVFEVIGNAKINVEEMQNVIYDGAEAACAKIQLASEPGEGLLQQIKANQHVLSLELTSLE